jgi:hypothetical protein
MVIDVQFLAQTRHVVGRPARSDRAVLVPTRVSQVRDLIRAAMIAASSAVLGTSCTPSDPQPPWDINQMLAEVASELRDSEVVASEFSRPEVLAWRVDARDNRDRIEIALIWGRVRKAGAPMGWALVQVFRRPTDDGIWQRSLRYRELTTPLTHPRPGENPDGTWNAFQRYDHVPTAGEICDFAAVDFFNEQDREGYRRAAAKLRTCAWLRAANERPQCGLTR